MTTHTGRALLAAILTTVVGGSVSAQTTGRDLSRATLEDLMNIEITSAARKEQRAFDAPAAIFVITQEDIRRSGLRTLPELFRLVPGMQVAQVNSSSWAVSVRGFNDLLADKVLVLVDGRTIYNPLFSGVFWDSEDIMLEDIERIEVIRGPGGAVWGANSTNGVINVITRSAAQTKGVLLRLGAGTSQRGDSAIRYGGALGESAAYRLFSQWSSHGESRTLSDTPAGDTWQSLSGGGRFDRVSGPNALMLNGQITWGSRNALWVDSTRRPQTVPLAGDSDAQHGHVIGRWTRIRPGGGSYEVQSFFDATRRRETIGSYDRNTVDVDVRYHGPVGSRHDLVAGGGYRYIQEGFHGSAGWTLSQDRQRNRIVNGFVQDEVALTASKRLALNLGAKLEHDTVAGANLQPSARVMWNLAHGTQRVWAATSRGVRTPSVIDRQFSVTYPYGLDASGLPILFSIRGNPEFSDQTVVEHEVGYRLAIGSAATVDVTAFTADYEGLRTSEPLAPVFEATPTPHILVGVQFSNLLRADTSGVEVAAHWQPLRAWRLEGNYSAFHVTPHLDPTSRDPTVGSSDGRTPSHQWRATSAVTFDNGASADVNVWYVGPLHQPPLSRYTRTDVRLAWPFGGGVSVDVVGQDIFDARHLEFDRPNPAIMSTLVSRAVSVHLTWVLTR